MDMNDPRVIHATGAKLSGESPKDYKMADFLVAGDPAIGYPEMFTHDPILPILNQGGVGSCVAHAAVTIKKFHEHLERDKDFDFSTDFIYHNRHANDTTGEGMVVRYMLDQLRKYGVCEKKLLSSNTPYSKTNTVHFSQRMFDNAKYQVLDKYASVYKNNKSEIRKALLMNGPLLAVIPTYTCFDMLYPTVWPGHCPKPDYVEYDPAVHGTALKGLHAVVILGYRVTPAGIEFRVQNSWSNLWGVNGTAWLSANYPILELWSPIDKFLPPPKEVTKIHFQIGNPKYTVNGKEYEMDTVPVAKDNRTLIPARFLASALSATINYVKSDTASPDRVLIYDVNTGQLTLYVGTNKYSHSHKGPGETDTITYVDENYRTMIPLRLVSETLGCEVKYNPSDMSIDIERTLYLM